LKGLEGAWRCGTRSRWRNNWPASTRVPCSWIWSASPTGRASYAELTPFLASEVSHDLASLQQLWLRGGYPLSHLSASDDLSWGWRWAVLRTPRWRGTWTCWWTR